MEDGHLSDMFQLDSMVDIDAIYSKGSRDSDGYDCILVYIHKPKRNGKASKIWSRKLWWVSRIGGKCISLWFGRHLIHTACWFAWSTHWGESRLVTPLHSLTWWSNLCTLMDFFLSEYQKNIHHIWKRCRNGFIEEKAEEQNIEKTLNITESQHLGQWRELPADLGNHNHHHL